jgi:hypothetical protein
MYETVTTLRTYICTHNTSNGIMTLIKCVWGGGKMCEHVLALKTELGTLFAGSLFVPGIFCVAYCFH